MSQKKSFNKVWDSVEDKDIVYDNDSPDLSKVDSYESIEKVKPDSIVYTDTFRSYNALDVSEFKHYRINHSKLFAKKHNHINGIENFWNQAKRHLRKFNGIPREHFHLFLKECEWRFNHSDSKEQLKLIRHWVRETLK
ncbi:putative transposase [Francisella tularensis subsp. novicida]|nr:putative transposase [Francisella tularensis subsp. novicida]KFJ70503.1 putative transposase [Francisella tularensis subsp. novicida]